MPTPLTLFVSPSPRLAGFGFPLKDYAAKPARLGSPVEAPLMNF